MIILIGCAGSKVQKEKDFSYKTGLYLTAEGIGLTEAESRNRALSEMSRIFEARIISDTIDTVKSVLDTAGTEVSEQRIESNIRVVSDVGLRGVKIVKVWKKDGYYHALATLDKAQAGDEWLFEVKDLDDRIEAYFRMISSTKSNFVKLKSLNEITALWMEREAVTSRLRVVGFEAEQRSYDIKSAFTMLPEIRAKMPVFVNISGEKGKEVQKDVSEALGKSGLFIAPDKTSAEVIVNGSVDIAPVDVAPQGIYYVRAKSSLSITETSTGLTIGEVSEDARGGHITYNEAERRAVKKLSAIISETIVHYFEGPFRIKAP